MTENRNEQHLSLIGEIMGGCESAGIRVWLFGGWGIDALLGTIRRAHRDIDLILHLSNRSAYRGQVLAIAAKISEDTPQKLRVPKDGIQCDTRFFHVLPDGRLVSDLDAHDSSVYPWPPDSFPEEVNGVIDGTPVRAVSWSAQFVAKAGYSAFQKGVPLREKDEADLEIIRKHLPPGMAEELEHYFPGIPKDRDTTQQPHGTRLR